MKNNLKKAFSLIEISIVILVVGVLIAGISRGLKMAHSEMILVTAKSLTDKAPVPNVEGLELWLETTSENSLAIGTTSFVNIKKPEDGQPIGRWNDLNPMALNSSYKNHALQATSNYQPLYMKDGINGLPALLFDGADDYIASTTKFITNNFTVFVVGFPIIKTSCDLSASITAGVSGQRYIVYPQQGDVIFPSNNAASAGVSLCTNFIAGFEHGNGYMPYVVSNTRTVNKPIQITLKYSIGIPKLYLNSTDSYSRSASGKNIFPGLTFGGGRPRVPTNYGEDYGYFKGYIGEIIVYSKDLSDTDRKLIETYLIEKWRIKI
jgi:prepilin-type N-terminal cleavage/methylation domain-containing protein